MEPWSPTAVGARRAIAAALGPIPDQPGAAEAASSADHWEPAPTLLTPDLVLGEASATPVSHPGVAPLSTAAAVDGDGEGPQAIPGVTAALTAALAAATEAAVTAINEMELDTQGRCKAPGVRGTSGPPKPPPAGRPAKAPRTQPTPGAPTAEAPPGNDAIMKNEKGEPPAKRKRPPRWKQVRQ